MGILAKIDDADLEFNVLKRRAQQKILRALNPAMWMAASKLRKTPFSSFRTVSRFFACKLPENYKNHFLAQIGLYGPVKQVVTDVFSRRASVPFCTRNQ